MECASLVLPMLYDMHANTTQIAERRELPAMALATASNHLRKFAEFHQQQNECTLFPAIRDLLMNLVLPTDPPMGGGVGGQQQVPQGVNVMNQNMGNF